MGGALGINPALAETESELGEFCGGLFRNARGCGLRAELVRVSEQGAEHIERRKRTVGSGRGGEQIIESESVNARLCPGEAGMDFSAKCDSLWRARDSLQFGRHTRSQSWSVAGLFLVRD